MCQNFYHNIEDHNAYVALPNVLRTFDKMIDRLSGRFLTVCPIIWQTVRKSGPGTPLLSTLP